MGTEVVSCCTQTLKDDNTLSDGFQEEAKLLSDFDNEIPQPTPPPPPPILDHITDIPSGLPSKSTNSKRRKSALQKYKKNKLRRQRLQSISLEEELEATELELLLQKQAIKLLRKQNEYLREQNEKFLLQYGSHFAVTTYTNSNPSTTSIGKHSHSLSLTSTQSNTSQISYSNISNSNNNNNKPQSPLCPLTPLTNK
eukprot:946949_1